MVDQSYVHEWGYFRLAVSGHILPPLACLHYTENCNLAHVPCDTNVCGSPFSTNSWRRWIPKEQEKRNLKFREYTWAAAIANQRLQSTLIYASVCLMISIPVSLGRKLRGNHKRVFGEYKLYNLFHRSYRHHRKRDLCLINLNSRL